MVVRRIVFFLRKYDRSGGRFIRKYDKAILKSLYMRSLYMRLSFCGSLHAPKEPKSEPTENLKNRTMASLSDLGHGQYRAVLLSVMNYSFSTDHDKAYSFTQEELLALRPNHIRRYMCFKVYGVPDPGDGDNPMEGRSSSLEYYKKAISYFMPNKLIAWDAQLERGNPTRSVEVNELIKLVKKKEVRKQGKQSAARRPMEQSG